MAIPSEVIKLLEDLKAEKEEVRKKAVITLGRHNFPEVKDALAELVNDSSTAVRYFAKKALKDFETMTAAHVEHSGGFDMDLSSMAQASVSPASVTQKTDSSSKAIASSDIFDRSGGSLTKMLNDLKNPDENVRIEAIKQLGEKKEVVATEPLLGLIHDSVRSVRLYTVQSLGLIGENRVLTPLLNLLNSEQDAFVVATLVKAIARVGGAQLIPIIARYLKDPDARTRANTIEALEIIGDPKIIKFLIPLLQDENNRVKANSIKVLSKFGKTNMFEKLDEMLDSDDASIRGSAIYALGAIGGEQVVELLEKAKNDEDPSNLKKLAEGLSKINNPKTIEILKEMANHPDGEVAEYAASFIGVKKGSDAVTAVEDKPQLFEPSAEEPAAAKHVHTEPVTQKPDPLNLSSLKTLAETSKNTYSKPPEPVQSRQVPVQKVSDDELSLQTFKKSTEKPRDYNSQDFEKLWNDVLLVLNNFQKHHPNFTKEKMSKFLQFLQGVIE